MLLIDEGPRHSSRMCPATSSNVSDAPSSVESKYARRVAESSDADSGIEESDAAPRTAPKLKLTAVPDLNGVRFCRVCREFLPTGMFPRGQRRFTCRPLGAPRAVTVVAAAVASAALTTLLNIAPCCCVLGRFPMGSAVEGDPLHRPTAFGASWSLVFKQ